MPCYYKVQNRHGELRPYSGKFDSPDQAKQWKSKYGIHLEQLFGRKLVLVITDKVEEED